MLSQPQKRATSPDGLGLGLAVHPVCCPPSSCGSDMPPQEPPGGGEPLT